MKKASPPALILASGSPRRRDILAAAGYEFEVVKAPYEEAVRQDAAASQEAVRLAIAKADAAKATRAFFGYPGERIVLAADTLVSIGSVIMGKPIALGDAGSMLKTLSGKTHKVHTGWCVAGDDFETHGVVTSEVRFRELSERDIAWYVSTGEPAGKAGAYAIQGAGVFLVDWVNGSYPNIVGLPLAEIQTVLDPILDNLGC
jgi:septum formation protein